MDKTYIYGIRVDRRVTQTIFDLPCIYSVHKEADDTPCYLLYDWDEQGNYKQAHPGDWLCLDEHGRWDVLTGNEREQYVKENFGKDQVSR